MKPMSAITVMLALFVAAGAAAAQACPGNTARVTSGTAASPNSGAGNLHSLVAGHTVCVSRGNERWQEYHAPNGDLIDYKRGPNDPMDPMKKVGTWSVTGVTPASPTQDPRTARGPRDPNATLTHTYGGTTYTFAVCLPRTEMRSANPSFVLRSNAGDDFHGVRILRGQVACP